MKPQDFNQRPCGSLKQLMLQDQDIVVDHRLCSFSALVLYLQKNTLKESRIRMINGRKLCVLIVFSLNICINIFFK